MLRIILENRCARNAEAANLLQQRPMLQSPIFPHPPTMGIASFRCLIKFLSGMGDVGRVNAHKPRWKSLPGLRESDTHKRACFFCWKQSRKLFEDSEWHCVFSCPVGNACRIRFQLAHSNIQSLSEHVKDGKEIFGTPSKCLRLPTSSDLARLIIPCRSDYHIASELARITVDLTASKRREFAKLAVRD